MCIHGHVSPAGGRVNCRPGGGGKKGQCKYCTELFCEKWAFLREKTRFLSDFFDFSL